MSGVLYTEQVIILRPRKQNGGSEVGWKIQQNEITLISTLQLKNFELCNVHIFQVFLRKSEKSTIGVPNKSSEKISKDNDYLGPKRIFLPLQSQSPVRIFVYGGSFQEVFLQKSVPKECCKFSCKRTPMLMCNFNKIATFY